MTEFMDVGQFHENERTGKWRFQKLGYAKRNDSGGIDVYLDALPIPGKYGVRMVVQPQRERDGQFQSPQNRAVNTAQAPNDEIPW